MLLAAAAPLQSPSADSPPFYRPPTAFAYSSIARAMTKSCHREGETEVSEGRVDRAAVQYGVSSARSADIVAEALHVVRLQLHVHAVVDVEPRGVVAHLTGGRGESGAAGQRAEAE